MGCPTLIASLATSILLCPYGDIESNANEIKERIMQQSEIPQTMNPELKQNGSKENGFECRICCYRCTDETDNVEISNTADNRTDHVIIEQPSTNNINLEYDWNFEIIDGEKMMQNLRTIHELKALNEESINVTGAVLDSLIRESDEIDKHENGSSEKNDASIVNPTTNGNVCDNGGKKATENKDLSEMKSKVDTVTGSDIIISPEKEDADHLSDFKASNDGPGICVRENDTGKTKTEDVHITFTDIKNPSNDTRIYKRPSEGVVCITVNEYADDVIDRISYDRTVENYKVEDRMKQAENDRHVSIVAVGNVPVWNDDGTDCIKSAVIEQQRATDLIETLPEQDNENKAEKQKNKERYCKPSRMYISKSSSSSSISSSSSPSSLDELNEIPINSTNEIKKKSDIECGVTKDILSLKMASVDEDFTDDEFGERII